MGTSEAPKLIGVRAGCLVRAGAGGTTVSAFPTADRTLIHDPKHPQCLFSVVRLPEKRHRLRLRADYLVHL
jgi:hypothetical protein